MRRMKAALLCTVLLLGLSGCGAEEANNASTSTPPSEVESSSSTQATTQQTLSIEYTCSVYDASGKQLQDASGNNQYIEFPNLNTVRASGRLTKCEGKYVSGPLSDTDQQAVQQAGYTEESSVGTLYGICATTIGYPVDNRGSSIGSTSDNPLVNEAQAKEALAALTICPDHPDAQQIRANAEAATKSDRDLSAKKSAGEVLDDGTYTIGSQMKPGSWKTSTDEVSNCYWELRDANGVIIQNDFITGAPSVTVQIPSTAASFTSNSCGTLRWTGFCSLCFIG